MSPEAPRRQKGGRPRIWVTRAQPGAAATAARLEALGFAAVVESVLEARPRSGAVIDLSDVEALAFTSAAGVAAFSVLTPVRDHPVFAVGDATAKAAREAGFADVRSADGDAAALASLIAGAALGPTRGLGRGIVLCPGAAEPAADLPGLLADSGVAARALAVYETHETPPAPPPANLFGVLVHSAKAARAVARRLSGAEASALTVLAISAAAAAPLAGLGLRRLAVAARPNETALLALLEA
jgi:uroporphyrinogen-III synthase